MLKFFTLEATKFLFKDSKFQQQKEMSIPKPVKKVESNETIVFHSGKKNKNKKPSQNSQVNQVGEMISFLTKQKKIKFSNDIGR